MIFEKKAFYLNQLATAILDFRFKGKVWNPSKNWNKVDIKLKFNLYFRAKFGTHFP